MYPNEQKDSTGTSDLAFLGLCLSQLSGHLGYRVQLYVMDNCMRAWARFRIRAAFISEWPVLQRVLR